MNAEALALLDQAVKGSLIVFLAAFLALAGYSWARLRRRRKGLHDLIEQEVDPALEKSLGLESQPASPWVKPSNRLRPYFYSLILAGVAAAFSFAVLAFAPLPFLHNFATEDSWNQASLRLTAVDYNRTFEGFELQGQVWNQSEQEIPQVMAVIEILDQERKTLDQLVTEVTPAPLRPATVGRFEFSYSQNSPLIYGYRLQFKDAGGNPIPHAEGFEVR